LRSKFDLVCCTIAINRTIQVGTISQSDNSKELLLPDDDFEQALNLDLLAASLRADKAEATQLLETLSKILLAAVPEHTKVERGGWMLSKDRPITEVTVNFEDQEYQIVRGKHGAFSGRVRKSVRGVVLRTSDISLDECFKSILRELESLAVNNAKARAALNKLVLG
jgi:hypothetical protein